jgi:uncharacterized protein
VPNHRNPLRLNVGFLLPAPIGTSRDFTFDFEYLKVDNDLTLGDFAGKAQFDRTPQGLLLQGKFQGHLTLGCVRCLNDFEHQLHFEMTELYAFNEKSITDSGLIMPEDGHIDLAPLIRDYALIEVPINPICKPDCKGLCPECGENLNVKDCGHRRDELDSPFAQLKDLLE